MAFVADQNAKASDLVNLNIGGERLMTVPRSTLTRVPDSMLAAMFSGRHKLRTDDNGRAFIDRCGLYVRMGPQGYGQKRRSGTVRAMFGLQTRS